MGCQREMKKVDPLGFRVEICLASTGNTVEDVGK